MDESPICIACGCNEGTQKVTVECRYLCREEGMCLLFDTKCPYIDAYFCNECSRKYGTKITDSICATIEEELWSEWEEEEYDDWIEEELEDEWWDEELDEDWLEPEDFEIVYGEE